MSQTSPEDRTNVRVAERNKSEAGAIPHQETFALGGDSEAVVEADELEGGGSPFGGEDGGGELEGVGGAEGMDTEEAPGHLENRVDRFDAMPMAGEDIEAAEGLGSSLRGETVLPMR